MQGNLEDGDFIDLYDKKIRYDEVRWLRERKKKRKAECRCRR